MENFEIVKKGYDTAAVDAAIAERDGAIKGLNRRIQELTEELRIVRDGGEGDGALMSAETLAFELESRAKARFEQETVKLKLFQDKWRSVADKATAELTPKEIEKMARVARQLQDIMNAYGVGLGEPERAAAVPVELTPVSAKTGKKLDKSLSKVKLPAAQVNQHAQPQAPPAAQAAAPVSVGEISQEEIINVKDSLADLCKELGLMD